MTTCFASGDDILRLTWVVVAGEAQDGDDGVRQPHVGGQAMTRGEVCDWRVVMIPFHDLPAVYKYNETYSNPALYVVM